MREKARVRKPESQDCSPSDDTSLSLSLSRYRCLLIRCFLVSHCILSSFLSHMGYFCNGREFKNIKMSGKLIDDRLTDRSIVGK